MAMERNSADEGASWKDVESDGSTLLFKEQEQERIWRTLLGKNKKGYKVSGSRNPPSRRFWNKSKEVPNDASWLPWP